MHCFATLGYLRRMDVYLRRMLGVLAVAGMLFFTRLGERTLWSEEVRWLQIPREMLASGDWFWPTINGHTYYDKPLGSYWLVLFSSFVTGCLDEHSARLPSAFGALLSVALLMAIARRLSGDRVALVSGVILATSFSFVFFARNASTDVETVAGVLATLWIFLKHDEHPSGWWILLLWVTMALTSLTKGLLGFALPILVITAYSWARAWPQRAKRISWLVDANRWLAHPATLLAVPLAAALYLGPFIASSAMHGSGDGFAMVYRENIRRFFDPVNHRGPIYLYGWVIFMLAAPWSLLLPAALVDACRCHRLPACEMSQPVVRDHNGRLFALVGFCSIFVFFTLSASRRSYYLLPILPFVALLIAQMLTSLQRTWLARGALVVLTVGVAASAFALVPAASLLPEPWDRLPDLPCPGGFVVAWLVAIAGIGFTWLRPDRRLAWAFGSAAGAFMLYLYLGALPALEMYRTQRPFAEAVKREVLSFPDSVALYRTREIVGQLDPPAPIAECHTPGELDGCSSRWLIMRRRDWERLQRPGTIVIAETVHPWDDEARMSEKLLLVEMKRPSRARSAAE
ncbi:MAG TPA: glycosyltransferase family 39 protein [Gemmataceae bacterium]|nr:glycosyltransferase family 39 protein [Gemmataceae bacterium]